MIITIKETFQLPFRRDRYWRLAWKKEEGRNLPLKLEPKKIRNTLLELEIHFLEVPIQRTMKEKEDVGRGVEMKWRRRRNKTRRGMGYGIHICPQLLPSPFFPLAHLSLNCAHTQTSPSPFWFITISFPLFKSSLLLHMAQAQIKCPLLLGPNPYSPQL